MDIKTLEDELNQLRIEQSKSIFDHAKKVAKNSTDPILKQAQSKAILDHAKKVSAQEKKIVVAKQGIPGLPTVPPQPSADPIDFSGCKQTLDSKYDTTDKITALGTTIDGKIPQIAQNASLATQLQQENNELFIAAVKLLINHLITANKSEYDSLAANHKNMLDKTGIIRADKSLDTTLQGCLTQILEGKYKHMSGGQTKGIFEELFGNLLEF